MIAADEERDSADAPQAPASVDYMQLLRDSEIAFQKGDTETGLQLLDEAASQERRSAAASEKPLAKRRGSSRDRRWLRLRRR